MLHPPAVPKEQWQRGAVGSLLTARSLFLWLPDRLPATDMSTPTSEVGSVGANAVAAPTASTAAASSTPALTPEQKQAARVKLAAMRGEMHALHQEMAALKQALQTMGADYRLEVQTALSDAFTRISAAANAAQTSEQQEPLQQQQQTQPQQ